MFLTGKSRGYFVEFNEYATLIARTSSLEGPLVVEQIKELPAGPIASVAPAFDEIAGKRRSGYRHAVCGIYPERRFIRRAALDVKRLKESGYLDEVLKSQFRAEPEQMILAILAAQDGSTLDEANLTAKEVVFCGSYSEDFLRAQTDLLTAGIYPERLEMGSVSTLGAVVNVLALQESKTPTLVLELGRESTQCYIVNSAGVDLARPVPHGINSMIPVVQKELGLKDEEGAAKLLFSNTFDFTAMGPVLVKKLLKELQSSIGFYEVQTGQSIGQMLCTILPVNLSWLTSTLSSSLGVGVLELKLAPWLQKQGIKFADAQEAARASTPWLGLLSLMSRNQPASTDHEAK
jgi:hypothetical protein